MRTIKRHFNLSGFTLAEMLITLGIIGVVAVMTIPILRNSYQKTQYLSELKKVYSSLSQAYAMILADNLGSFKNVCSTSNCIKELLVEKMKIIKDCSAASSLGNCSAINQPYLSISQSGNNAIAMESFVLQDGTSVAIWPDAQVSSTCTDSRVVIKGLNASCGMIQVDLNGLNPPNTDGEDIYLIHILADRLLPVGGTYSHAHYQYCDKNNTTIFAGNGCAYVVLNGGWHK